MGRTRPSDTEPPPRTWKGKKAVVRKLPMKKDFAQKEKK